MKTLFRCWQVDDGLGQLIVRKETGKVVAGKVVGSSTALCNAVLEILGMTEEKALSVLRNLGHNIVEMEPE